MKRKYAIDFDGVLINHETVPTREDWYNDLPMSNSSLTLNTWLDEGIELYILTARTPEEWPRIETWLNMYSFPKLRITNVKEHGTDVFIDDRAVRFTNWKDMSRLL